MSSRAPLILFNSPLFTDLAFVVFRVGSAPEKALRVVCEAWLCRGLWLCGAE
jgi:hypothetical protein